MKNITLKIDDEVYLKARLKAAREGTSVSAMVREFLDHLPDGDEAMEKHRRMVASMEEIYAEADARAIPRTEPLIPLSREQIYAERLR